MTRGTGLTSIVALSFAAALAACGGGGSTSEGPAPAVITTQPANQAAVEGTTATFSVVATGATGYQWQRSSNGGATFTDVSAATAASYVTPATTMADHGTRYRVAVSGAGGSVTSNAAQLTVTAAPVAPVITTDPADVTVVEGQNATFTVAVTGTPAPTLKWQQSTDGGAAWTDLAGATSATLDVLAAPLTSNGWQYRAVASNAAGAATSNAAQLTVTAAPVAPAFTTQPASVTVTEGQNATFTVAVTGTPAPTLQWQQSTDGGAAWTDVAGATGATLDVLGAPLSSSGWQYRAVASNTTGTATSNAATLTVHAAPVFTTQPANAGVNPGQNATFTVAVTGAPAPTLQWQLSTDGGAAWTDVAGATGATLDVLAVQASSNGWQYRAVASNSVGTVNSDAATLAVYAPPAFTSQPRNLVVLAGQNARFTAIASGTPWPTYQWQQSTDGGATWTDVAGATTAALNLVAVPLTSNGWRYRSVAANLVGTATSNPARLTVEARSWGAPALIETNDVGDASSPQVAMDANGNALAVWVQDGDSTAGVRYDVWAASYTGGVWGAPTLIETDDTGTAMAPQVAFDSNGNAMAVWHQDTAGSTNIWANRFTGGAWGTATMIGASGALGINPGLAVDSLGNALVVWIQVDTSYHIWSNRYTAGTGWGTPVAIESNVATSANAPQVAFDAGNNAMAIWNQTTAAAGSVWSNRYTAGTGWGTPTLVEPAAGNTFGAQVACGASNTAVATWARTDGTVYSAWSSSYAAGLWGAPVLLENSDTGSAGSPQLALDYQGNGLAVWAQSNGTIRSLWANRYTTAAGWGSEELLEFDNGSTADNPHLAFDGGGNAVAVWNQFRPIAYARYVPGTGWGAAGWADVNQANLVTGNPRVAADASGNAVAVWTQWDGAHQNVVAAVYK